MTVKEKAQAYDKAIERARKLKENPEEVFCEYTPKEGDTIADYIFPELEESEDEKIRKALIRQFNSLNTIEKWGGIEREKIIAWLEKQKPLNRNVNTIPFLSHYEPKCYQPDGTCTNPLHDCLECPKFSLYRGTYTSTL